MSEDSVTLDTSVAARTRGSHHADRRVIYALAPICALFALWIVVVVAFRGPLNGSSIAGDFAVSLTASQVQQEGKNPYDRPLLVSSERRYLLEHGLRPSQLSGTSAYLRTYLRTANPPLYFWMLRPFTGLTFPAAAMLALAASLALLLAGILLSLRSLGWSTLALPSLLFLASPQASLAAYYVNSNVLMFAGLGLAMAMLQSLPVAAGAVLVVAWLKPQLGLPIVLLIAAFLAPRRWALAAGFGGATLVMILGTLVACGPASISQWIAGMLSYPGHMEIGQDLASLGAALPAGAADRARLAIEAAGLAVAAVLSLATWWTTRSAHPVPVRRIAWLWFAWFLAVPFAHQHDEILLAIPLFAVLGKNGVYLLRPLTLCAVYLVAFSYVAIAVQPWGMHTLWLPILLATACMYAERNEPLRQPAPLSPLPDASGSRA